MTLKKQQSTFWNSSFEKARGAEVEKIKFYLDKSINKIKIEGYPNHSFPDANAAQSWLEKTYKLDKKPYRGRATTRVKDKDSGKVIKYKYPKAFTGIKEKDKIKNLKTLEELEVEKTGTYHVIGKTKDGKRHMFTDPGQIKKVKA